MMAQLNTRQWILIPLLCLLPSLIESSSYNKQPAFFRSTTKTPLILTDIRGGSTSTSTSSKDTALSKYSMEQLLLLQARSNRLRQALTERGLIQDYSQLDAPTKAQIVDWDCLLATRENPKTCLYTWDAEPNTKVVAPAGTTEYISLTQLNRLRRTEPSKLEPLWHSKYAIAKSWFQSSSPYSFYVHLPWQGYLLALLLDIPLVLNLVVMFSIYSVLALTRAIWEPMVNMFLTSPYLWLRWPSWARFLHAPLPLKLMLGQWAWAALSAVYKKIKGQVREYLIQAECRIWEESIPLTILEGDMLERYNRRMEDDDEEESIVAGMATEEDSSEAETEEETTDDDEDSDDE